MPQVLRTLRINGGRMERLRGARYATGSTNVENQWWQNGKNGHQLREAYTI